MQSWFLYSLQRTLMDIGKWGPHGSYTETCWVCPPNCEITTSRWQNLAKKVPSTWKGSSLPGHEGELRCRPGVDHWAATQRRQKSCVWQEADTQGRFKQGNTARATTQPPGKAGSGAALWTGESTARLQGSQKGFCWNHDTNWIVWKITLGRLQHRP